MPAEPINKAPYVADRCTNATNAVCVLKELTAGDKRRVKTTKGRLASTEDVILNSTNDLQHCGVVTTELRFESVLRATHSVPVQHVKQCDVPRCAEASGFSCADD